MQRAPSQQLGLHAILLLVVGRVAMWGVWGLVPTKPEVEVLVAVMLLDGAVLLLQLRHARRAIRTEGASLLSYTLGFLCLIAIAVVAVTGLNRMSEHALLPAPVLKPAADLRVVDGTAYVVGDISFATYTALLTALQNSAELHTLSLDSGGGRIPAARGMARLVQEARLNTHVVGLCSSACTLILAAGQTRTAASEARIGFHGYKLLSGVATVNVAEEEARDRVLLSGYGIKSDFLEKAFSVPFEDMWFPSRTELLAAGVLTD